MIGTWGIEIEIGVDNTFTPLSNWQIQQDGSIHCNKRGLREIELVSPVYNDYKTMINDVLKYKKMFKEANESMGLHIHFKPTKQHYAVFSNKHFIEFFNNKFMLRFPKIWEERSDNNYCKRLDNIDLDVSNKIQKQIDVCYKDTQRYSEINFCLNTHKTIEFRIFNSTTSINKIVRRIRFLNRIMDEFVKTYHFDDIKTAVTEDNNITEIEVK